MKITANILLLILLIQISMPARAQTSKRVNTPEIFSSLSEYSCFQNPYSQANLLALNKEAHPGPGEIQYEHPLRRFEITFFISLPFVFVISFVSLHTFDAIKRKDPNVNVWKNYKPYLLGATFSISAAIAFREAWICMDLNKKRSAPGMPSEQENMESFNEQNIYIYAVKKY